MKVYILTTCFNRESLYGSTLVFDTLRVGFPTAEVKVIDQSPDSECAREIERRAKSVGCNYIRQERTLSLAEYYCKVLEDVTSGTLVFLDADTIFFEKVEEWKIDKPIAGRYIPTILNTFINAPEIERLHNSFIWVRDVNEFKTLVGQLPHPTLYFNIFLQALIKLKDIWIRYEIWSQAYAVLKDHIHHFTDVQLDTYAHLQAGSHLKAVLPRLPPEDASELVESHFLAQTDPSKLRGLWRSQNAYFEKKKVNL